MPESLHQIKSFLPFIGTRHSHAPVFCLYGPRIRHYLIHMLYLICLPYSRSIQMKTIFTILFTLTVGFTVAQSKPDDPANANSLKGADYDWSWRTSPSPSFTPPPPDPVPIDGGLGFLIVAGVGYGLKRMRNKD